ncbi:carotenoid biosynthesis protein [Pedosphaera parvula]|uniref:Carotenoid biosynthesis protein n=1 Tax=Pedosphaera parvula (strain Ellin514) TaxID=320771 RepID=B9XIF7_PEDPL|nr:carotenoid biosynthesis protein [Pedosphaera parvula]EEF60418.1 hypothetical protein Cflav_PD3388 [Pedosphaera parvula Ellin514]
MLTDHNLNRNGRLANWVYKLLWILFLACCMGRLLGDLAMFPLQNARILGDGFPVMAAILSVATLMRTLPAENSIMVAIYVIVISTVLTMIEVRIGILSGPISFTNVFGHKLFGRVPWAMPFIWVTLLINSRGVAKLILRPWRKARYYGFGMMGLTSLLIVLLSFQLEPFATRVNDYWHFTTQRISWYDTPWTTFLDWFIGSLIILAFTTLWFINKKPVKSEPVDFLPLLIWLIILGLLTTANLHHHLLTAGILGIATVIIVSPSAVAGARSKTDNVS